MRVLIVPWLMCALAAAAWAAGEFPYYPEYADVFSRYDEVTPEMAVAAAGAWPGEATFAEPLLLRDINGMPYCYMVEAFPAEDRDLVATWNEVIAKVNAGAPLPAAELAGELEALYAVEYAPSRFGEFPGAFDEVENPLLHFAGAAVPTFTFDHPGPALGSSGGPPFPALRGYARAYHAATAWFEEDDAVYFSRIIAAGPEHVQILEFENDAGEKVALAVDAELRPHPADLEENAAFMREAVRKKYDLLKEDPTWADKNRARWRELAAGLE